MLHRMEIKGGSLESHVTVLHVNEHWKPRKRHTCTMALPLRLQTSLCQRKTVWPVKDPQAHRLYHSYTQVCDGLAAGHFLLM